jgi:hypothetical protein
VIILTILSILYLTSLAVVDGLFNRLIFREKRKLSYFSEYKQEIFKLWEWRGIGFIFLLFLPIFLPVVTLYLFAGITYVTTYLIILILFPWDFIFGALVFNNWLGDTPSIALPYFGWTNFPLWKVTLVRILLAMLILLYLFIRP